MIHPSTIALPEQQQRLLPVDLTKAKVEANPVIAQNQAVTMQLQSQL